MIVRIEGLLLERDPPTVVIDVGGLGYEVELPLPVFENLPALGERVALLTHLVVREDAHILYGFARESERALFRQLVKISGIGPRSAMNILSGVKADDFAVMIEAGDVKSLTRLPGIGKKTAERLIVEMRGKISDLAAPGESGAARSNPETEAREALVALGYSSAEALKMVRAVAAADLSAEALIRAALREKMQGA